MLAAHSIMHILVIEDDYKVQGFLRESLQNDFTVTTFSSFPTDIEFNSLSSEPHTIILDRLLGNSDSKMQLPILKARFPNTFIIVLSAISNASERAELLDLGVDDYVGKPFSITELKARIRALTRRSSKVEQLNYVNLEGTILDFNQRHVTFENHKVSLSSKEYELFYVFAKNPGRVFSKFELMDKVWQANLEIESNVLEVTVMNIRRKLLEINSKLQVCSKRNIGYWLEI